MRLIDADALMNKMQKDPLFDLVERYGVSGVINAEPTVEAEPVIRCKDCGQREYGCSTFIDHNQIYGFCAWGWKAEREEE